MEFYPMALHMRTMSIRFWLLRSVVCRRIHNISTILNTRCPLPSRVSRSNPRTLPTDVAHVRKLLLLPLSMSLSGQLQSIDPHTRELLVLALGRLAGLRGAPLTMCVASPISYKFRAQEQSAAEIYIHDSFIYM